MPVFTQGPLGQQCVGSIHIVTSAGHCAWTSAEHGFEEGTFMFRKEKKGDAKSFFSFFYSLFNYFPLFFILFDCCNSFLFTIFNGNSLLIF